MSANSDPTYPKWICHTCGQDFGNWYQRGAYVGPPHWNVTMHQGDCQLCGLTNVTVCSPRDYGHLQKDWKINRHNKTT